MSCEKCRCAELKEIRLSLDRIRQAYEEVGASYRVLDDCKQQIGNMGDMQIAMHDADNKYEVDKVSKSEYARIHFVGGWLIGMNGTRYIVS